MDNSYVQQIGSVEDIDGRILKVGVDYDSVTIGSFRLTQTQADNFARFFNAACWEAGENRGLMVSADPPMPAHDCREAVFTGMAAEGHDCRDSVFAGGT